MIERELNFDTQVYSIDAIQRATYKLSDRLSCDMVLEAGSYRCTLHCPDVAEHAVEALLADFRNEVLDEMLRARIRAETQDARNVILALAFSNTGLVDPENA